MLKRMVISSLVISGAACFLFAQWEPDTRLTFEPAESFTSVGNAWSIGTDSLGNIHVVWYDTRDLNSEIYYKRSTDKGRTWGPDTRLTDNITASAWPAISVVGTNVHVVWKDEVALNGDEELYYKRSTDEGTTWEPSIRLTDAVGRAMYPCVSATGANIHVMWVDDRVGNYEIYYKRSTDSGVNWESDMRISANVGFSCFPSVAVSGNNVHAAWSDLRLGYYWIYYRHSTDGGITWSPETCLTFGEVPSISVSGDSVHVVYENLVTVGNYEICYKRSTDGGITWEPDTQLTNAPDYSLCPSIAASGANVHIVWQDFRNPPYEIYYKRSTDAGTTWEPDTQLTNAPGSSTWPSITLSNTIVHVVWCDFRDGNWEIYYKRNPSGNVVVEENMDFGYPISDIGLKAYPNPFLFYTTVSRCEKEKFVVYDISGREVGIYKGERIGVDLLPGIYFLRNFTESFISVKIVKVR